MKTVENGDKVKVSFTGTLQDGQVFASNQEESPLEVEVGAGAVIKGFEEALVGMGESEKKSVTLQPEQAFGDRDDTLHQSFQREDLPEGFNPQTGEMVTLQTAQGKEVPAMVIDSDEEKVTVDLNHPLAGKELNFDIEVLEISKENT